MLLTGWDCAPIPFHFLFHIPNIPHRITHHACQQVGAVRNYLGIVAIHALELRRQEAVALLIGNGMATVDVDAQEQVLTSLMSFFSPFPLNQLVDAVVLCRCS